MFFIASTPVGAIFIFGGSICYSVAKVIECEPLQGGNVRQSEEYLYVSPEYLMQIYKFFTKIKKGTKNVII